MANARSTLAVLLLFVWTASPALRCLLPGQVLTPEEQACCNTMAGQCGESAVAHHPCCKTAAATAEPALASAQASGIAIVPIAVAIPAHVQPQAVQNFSPAWLVDPSPPPRLEQTSPILRI